MAESDGVGSATRNGSNGVVTHDRPGVEGILKTLVEHASRPLEEAQALPGEWYTNEELYRLEMERIFEREWMCVGRADEISRPGDWLTTDVAGEHLVVVRGEDHEIRALSRACPHRFADLLGEEEGDRGHTEGFVCPYHSWAFDRRGNLTGAPLMHRNTRFERTKDSICLTPFRVELWNGFIFINLDDDAAPLAPRLADAGPMLERYRLDEWRTVSRVDWPEMPVNWKIVMDNSRESYHSQGLHKHSVEPLWPTHLTGADTTDSKYWYAQYLHVSPEAAVGEDDGHLVHPLVLPALDGLNAFDRSCYLLFGIYPTMFMAPGPDLMIYALWRPTGFTSHKFEISLCVHESNMGVENLDEIVAESHAWLMAIQTEDASVYPSIQRMLTSKKATRAGGPLSHIERPLWQFQRYMAERLVGVDL